MILFKLSLLVVSLGALGVNGYFLQGISPLKPGNARKDPIVSPGAAFSNHTHLIAGSSNFDSSVTSDILRAGACTTVPISEDHSNYWVGQMYFRWANGSFSSVDGGFVIYYLFDENVNVTAFPENFRMISGNHMLRDYDPTSFAQRAVTHMCLDFNGVSKTYNHFPSDLQCDNGVRSQINFPSCWDGVNLDSPDHISHVAFPSGGPDSGTCDDPKYPVTIPRIFIETYWDTTPWNDIFDQSASPHQPFCTSQGDATGYGWHADFYNGWENGILQNILEKCDCTIAAFGDPTCCADLGVMNYRTNVPDCGLADPSTEQETGTLNELPGGNIVTGLIASTNGEIFANGTWDLAVPLSEQPKPVVLPGTGNPVVASTVAAAAASSSVVSSAKATSTVVSSAKASSMSSAKVSSTASSSKVVSTAAPVKTPTAAPSSSSTKSSNVSVSKPATSSAHGSSVVQPSSMPGSVGLSSGSSSDSNSGNDNGNNWSAGSSSSGSASSGDSSSSSSGQSSNNAGSSPNNSNSGSSSSGNQAPAQNSLAHASSSGSSGTSNTQAAQASAGMSSSSSSSQNSNGGSGSKSSGNSGSNSSFTSSGSSSSSSSNSNAGAGSSASGSSAGSGNANSSSQNSNFGMSSGSSGNNVAASSGNTSSGSSKNADKCKNRHASSLEARAAEVAPAPVNHAAVHSHHARSRAYNRLRSTGDLLA